VGKKINVSGGSCGSQGEQRQEGDIDTTSFAFKLVGDVGGASQGSRAREGPAKG
jgi:hypothetical protein